MNIAFFGPPGSGKGTQAKQLVERHGFMQISTGDLVRAEIQKGSPIGKKIQDIVEQGKFPSSDIINEMVTSVLKENMDGPGFLFDGYPRNLEQGQFLEGLLAELNSPIDLAIFLDVPDQILIDRVTTRYSCDGCGAIYNAIVPTKQEGICDKCGGTQFTQRADDTAEVMQTRLATYREQTAAIVDHFDTQGRLHRIDGNREVDVITNEINSMIENLSRQRGVV